MLMLMRMLGCVHQHLHAAFVARCGDGDGEASERGRFEPGEKSVQMCFERCFEDLVKGGRKRCEGCAGMHTQSAGNAENAENAG
jgi:hypothetical protein